MFNNVNMINNSEKALSIQDMKEFLEQPTCNPETNCFVRAAREGESSVGAESDRGDRAFMPGPVGDYESLFQVPELDRPVLASGEGPFSIRADTGLFGPVRLHFGYTGGRSSTAIHLQG